MRTSYVFPLYIYKPKIYKAETLNQNQNNNPNIFVNNNLYHDQTKTPINSFQNIQKEYYQQNKSQKTTIYFPPVQQSKNPRNTLNNYKNNQYYKKTSSLMKSAHRRNQFENKIQPKELNLAFQQEKFQIIQKHPSISSKWKQAQISSQNFSKLKVNPKKIQQSTQQQLKNQNYQNCLKQRIDNQISINEVIKANIVKPHQKNKVQIIKNDQKTNFKQLKQSNSESNKRQHSEFKQNNFMFVSQMQSFKKISTINYDLVLQELNIVNGVFFEPSSKKILVYVGNGNNKHLVQQIFKKRIHFQISKNIKQAQIIWLQKSQDDYFHCQQFKSSIEITYKDCIKEKLMSKNLVFSQDIYPKLVQKSHLFMNEDIRKITNFYTKNQKIRLQSNILIPIIQNHVPGHKQISDKKNLYMNVKRHCKQKNIQMVDFLPKTFLVKKQLTQLEQYIRSYPSKNMWIIKPSQNSNQGRGISITINNKQLYNMIYNCDLKSQSLIVQQYLTNCLLYHNRKFDIRTYILVTNNGTPKCYWYNDGYVRTSGHKFDINSHSEYVHLTNDAIQNSSPDYGKYETCNKISYSTLQRYIQVNYPSQKNFIQKINTQMKQIAQFIMQATLKKLVQNSLFNYEIFGLDFMVDNNFKVYLIQVNTNPCLQTQCPLLQRVIPTMLEQAFRIAVDPIFKNSLNSDQNRNYEKGKFELLPIIEAQRNF